MNRCQHDCFYTLYKTQPKLCSQRQCRVFSVLTLCSATTQPNYYSPVQLKQPIMLECGHYYTPPELSFCACGTTWPLLPWAVLLYCSPGNICVWHQSPLPPQKVTHAWVSLPFHLLPAEVWGNFLRVVRGERKRGPRRSPAPLLSLILSGKSNGSLRQQQHKLM